MTIDEQVQQVSSLAFLVAISGNRESSDDNLNGNRVR
jgi:hypothetical protein